MKKAVYPGSFDPITLGHIDIIKRASHIFDEVVVCVLTNSKKTPSFSEEERVELIKKVTREFPNVTVLSYAGLLIDFMRQQESHVIVKGLRAVSDFEYEFQMALANNELAPQIETLFLTTCTEYSYLSSSIVREIASYGGDITRFVPPEIKQDIYEKFQK